MINDEFSFYDTNQESIVKGHIDEFVVIKDKKVRGYYESEDAAFDSMIGEELGSFMVKCCKEPGTDIICMDILTLGDLAITNHDHRTVVSFRVPPDTVHIDFVAAANDSNL